MHLTVGRVGAWSYDPKPGSAVSIHALHRGAGVIDTFFVGTLKGVDKVYLQTVLDCYNQLSFGRLYNNKLPLTAVHVLNNDVLPRV
ncbi:Uncharacterised protein [Achromobacter xylosoxidans]|nr:Uncharacterised protein [Achromobacter xylosoxidans]